MADEADLANDHIMEFERVSLLARKPKGVLQPMGCCHNCFEDFLGDRERLFCDKLCRDDLEKREAYAKINGR